MAEQRDEQAVIDLWCRGCNPSDSPYEPCELHSIDHDFDPGYSGMSTKCNRLVMREGVADTCDEPRSQHPRTRPE